MDIDGHWPACAWTLMDIDGCQFACMCNEKDLMEHDGVSDCVTQ